MEAPEFFQSVYCPLQLTPEKMTRSDGNVHGSANGGEQFLVEEFFDFPNELEYSSVTPNDSAMAANGASTESSTVTAVESCNSSSPSNGETRVLGDGANRSFPDGNFSNDLCVPYDDMAELEWLSNFVEESFSSEDLQKLQLISGKQAQPDEGSETRGLQPDTNNKSNPIFPSEMPVPGKARSKRSRAAPCDWSSRLLVLSPTSSSSESNVPPPLVVQKPGKGTARKKDGSDNGEGSGRKCLHCATDKTPQWRTGPMGPKTLCNACGVRFKSGRLVPEYRPAASPTFVLTKHSNSHRKVLELRRQKEVVRSQQQLQHQQLFFHQQNMLFEIPNGDDYLIHQNIGPDFRQLI